MPKLRESTTIWKGKHLWVRRTAQGWEWDYRRGANQFRPIEHALVAPLKLGYPSQVLATVDGRQTKKQLAAFLAEAMKRDAGWEAEVAAYEQWMSREAAEDAKRKAEWQGQVEAAQARRDREERLSALAPRMLEALGGAADQFDRWLMQPVVLPDRAGLAQLRDEFRALTKQVEGG